MNQKKKFLLIVALFSGSSSRPMVLDTSFDNGGKKHFGKIAKIIQAEVTSTGGIICLIQKTLKAEDYPKYKEENYTKTQSIFYSINKNGTINENFGPDKNGINPISNAIVDSFLLTRNNELIFPAKITKEEKEEIPRTRIIKLDSNGIVDFSYGLDLQPGSRTKIQFYQMVEDPQGRVLIYLKHDGKDRLMRMNHAGKQDMSFGRNGAVTLLDEREIPGSVNEQLPIHHGWLNVLPDGKIIVQNGENLTILNENGSIDAISKSAFQIINELRSVGVKIDMLKVTPQGKILILFKHPVNKTEALGCYTTDGGIFQQDKSFVFNDNPLIGLDRDSNITFTVLPDGKIVIGQFDVGPLHHGPTEGPYSCLLQVFNPDRAPNTSLRTNLDGNPLYLRALPNSEGVLAISPHCLARYKLLTEAEREEKEIVDLAKEAARDVSEIVETDCTICLKPLKGFINQNGSVYERVVEMQPCGHRIHFTCAQNLSHYARRSENQPQCPVCRAPVASFSDTINESQPDFKRRRVEEQDKPEAAE